MTFSKIFNSKQKGNVLRASKGFTLIELLVVIGILAVLLAITLIAINPARQFAQANDTKRRSDVSVILNAINQYMADNKGNLPATAVGGAAITATPTNMGNTLADVDICVHLISRYVSSMPVDPKNGTYTSCTAYNTVYRISQAVGGDNRITVSATPEISGTTISVTR